MSDRSAYVDYQQRASEFEVDDLVYPFMSGNADTAGRVVTVYPAIGMVEVEWPHGSQRFPVEELHRLQPKHAIPPEAEHNNVPGGATGKKANEETTMRIAQAFVKKSLYWAARDRHYKATKVEIAGGRYNCPKCKTGALRPAAYKRRDGTSERLLGCPGCLFLVKRSDIIGHPDYYDQAADQEAQEAQRPFSGIRLARQKMMGE